MFGPVCRVLVVGLMVGMVAVAAPGPGDPEDPPPTAAPCTLSNERWVYAELPCGGWEGDYIVYIDPPTYIIPTCVNGNCVQTDDSPWLQQFNCGPYQPTDPPGHPAYAIKSWRYLYDGTGELVACGNGMCCQGQAAVVDYTEHTPMWFGCAF